MASISDKQEKELAKIVRLMFEHVVIQQRGWVKDVEALTGADPELSKLSKKLSAAFKPYTAIVQEYLTAIKKRGI